MSSRFLISPVFIVGLLWLIAILHLFGIYLHWYWTYVNFDIVHHFLGGVWLSAFFFYYFGKRQKLFDVRQSRFATLLFALGVTALAGVIWEFYEFGMDYFFDLKIMPLRHQNSLADTIGDLFFDLLGGLIYAILYLTKGFSTRRLE